MKLDLASRLKPSLNPPFAWGEVHGKIELSRPVLARAEELVKRMYKLAEDADFSEDAVESIVVPGWAPKLESWEPVAHLECLGFRLKPEARMDLLFTVGVDPHEDDVGPTLALVLHNDGLKFIQGKIRHQTVAGEWFIFDTTKTHEVRESAKTTGYLCLTVPLERI